MSIYKTKYKKYKRLVKTFLEIITKIKLNFINTK